MAPKLHNFLVQLSYLPQTLRLVWKAARGLTIAWVVLLFVQGLLPTVTVYLTRLLIDSLVTATGAGSRWQSIQPTIFLAVMMGCTVLLAEMIQSASSWIGAAQAEYVKDYLTALVHGKAITVDLAFYESPEYHDQLDRARNDLSSRPVALLESSGSLLRNSITLLTMAALLIPYAVWLPVVLLVSTLPAFLVLLRYNRRYHNWWTQATPDRRRAQYYDALLTSGEAAAELRLFDLGHHLMSAYQALRGRLRTEQIKLTRDQSLAHLGAAVVGAMIAGAVMLWMVWQALKGLFTLGDLALFYQIFSRGQSLLHSLLGSLGQIYSNTLFLGNLFEFLGLKLHVVESPKPTSPSSTLKEGISFRGVAFRYPGSKRLVLHNFDLLIPRGQIVAIVGPNGAGKSTLIKLLCRFYDTEMGRIALDGIDIRDLSLKELRRMITVLFQWPFRYHTTAAQNIAFGDMEVIPDSAEIETAARGAGAHEIIAGLAEGYDTILGKWFSNGTELSGGEWQRLALARAFLRRADIMILDEPTSALDSWAEADWFDRFRALAKDRTAIIITHHFTIARRADMIHVMDSGRIVESGTHEELLVRNGLYAQSWTAQMQARPGRSDFARRRVSAMHRP